MSSEWISVKDRLPDATRRYLAFAPGMGEFISTYSCLESGWVDSGGATHWMDLPETPPSPKLTVKEALREAVECLESMNPLHYGRHIEFRGEPLLPRLRAALEGEE